jgi:hypothetical protein
MDNTRHTKLDLAKRVALLPLVLVATTAVGCAQADRTEFKTPEQATDSLVGALRHNDKKALRQILGPDAASVLDSGDRVADRENAEEFIAAYDRKHAFVRASDDAVTLTVGESKWPMPIPLVEDDGVWTFATEDGKEEMLARRIGRNELDAIQVSLAIVDAQDDYARMDPERDGLPTYASKFFSDPGKRNGLYYPTSAGEPQSPLGPMIGEATEEGYRRSSTGEPTPYHGYYFRMLTGQGPNAKGGARDYVVNGRQLGGFGVVAWPASLGKSGIMTFIVNQDGVVYEKYLGASTDSIARSMTRFDPGPGWKKVPVSKPD